MITEENEVIVECPGTDIINALIDVISAYYVFDLTYADGMVVMLSFLQEIVLKSKDGAYKGTKYSTLMSELNVTCQSMKTNYRRKAYLK